MLFLVGTHIFNTFMQGLFVVLFLLSLWLLTYKRLPVKGYIGNMGAFILFSLLSTIWASNRDNAIISNITLINCAVLGLCIYVNCDSREKLIKLLACYSIGVLLLDIYCYSVLGFSGLMQLGGQSLRLGVETGTDLNSNYIGNINALGTLIVLYLISIYKKKYLFLLPVIFVFFISLSASRSAFIVLAFGYILYTFLFNTDNKNTVRILIYIAVGIILIVIAYYMGLLDVILARFIRANETIAVFFMESRKTDQANIRLRLIYEALILFTEKPVLGYGCGQFNSLMVPIFGFPYSPHNAFTQSMVSYGIFGLVFWQGMYIKIIQRLRKEKADSMAMIIVILILCWLMHDMFSHSLSDKTSYLLLAIGFAAINMLRKNVPKRDV